MSRTTQAVLPSIPHATSLCVAGSRSLIISSFCPRPHRHLILTLALALALALTFILARALTLTLAFTLTLPAAPPHRVSWRPFCVWSFIRGKLACAGARAVYDLDFQTLALVLALTQTQTCPFIFTRILTLALAPTPTLPSRLICTFTLTVGMPST